MSTTWDLGIVVPVFNEEDHVESLISDWNTIFVSHRINHRFFIVNDGSTDRSLERLESMQHKSFPMAIISQSNKGHGPAILHGYAKALATAWVFQIDADHQFDVSAFADLWRHRNDYDLLIAERVQKNASIMRNAVSVISGALVRQIFGKGVRDVNSPYRLCRSSYLAEAISKIPEKSFAPEYIANRLLCIQTSPHLPDERKDEYYNNSAKEQNEFLFFERQRQVTGPNGYVSFQAMKKEQIPTLIVVTVCMLLSLGHCPWFEIFFDDKDIFRYAGLVIDKGGVPYRDFFDHKPPLIYFLNYFGWLFGPWGLWIIDSLLVLLASLMFLGLCRTFKIVRPWILPVLFNLLIRYSLVSEGIGMTREYTAIFLLIFFCVMLGTSRYKYYLLGLLAGLSFFMQQDQLITLAPFAVYALFAGFNNQPAEIAVRVLRFGIGFLIIAAPVLAYFMIHHSLLYFWEDAFLFNTKWYMSSMDFGSQVATIKHKLHITEFDLTFYTAMILGIAGLFLNHSNKRLLITCLLGVVLSFSAEYLSGKLGQLSVSYYFLPLAATIPMLVFAVFSFASDPGLRTATSQLIFGIILSVNLIFGTIRYLANQTPRGNHRISTPELMFLEKESLKDYQLFVFGDPNYIYAYNQFRILAPSKWVYQHFYYWHPGWDRDLKTITEMTANLVDHKTTYVLDYSDYKRIKNEAAKKVWKTFLQNRYTRLSMEGKPTALWRINP